LSLAMEKTRSLKKTRSQKSFESSESGGHEPKRACAFGILKPNSLLAASQTASPFQETVFPPRIGLPLFPNAAEVMPPEPFGTLKLVQAKS